MGIWDDAERAGREFEIAGLWDAELCDRYTAVLRAGAMLSFGLSRDGGAISVSVVSHGRTARKWAGSLAELEDHLALFAEAAARGDFDAPPPPARGGPR